VTERGRVAAALRGQGWDLPEAQGNFVWFPLGDETVRFAQACDAAGVSVRPFPGDGARVTIGETAANDLMLDVARGWRECGIG
jgi:histidinol-phosphate aminotransferase